jgi:hypothetical protein
MDDSHRIGATSVAPVDRVEFVAILAITVLAAACRVAALRQPMRYDEAVAWAEFIGRSWWTILSEYPNPNNHVFFSLLAKGTSSIAPFHPWAIRLPAVIPGIAIVPATWLVGRRLADRSTALLGAALAAGSMSLVLFSANARGHSLVVLGGLALVLLGDRLRVHPARTADWVWFVLVSAFGLWTAPLMVYPIGAVSLWLLMGAVRRHPASEGAPSRWAFDRALVSRLVVADVAALALAWLLYLPIIANVGLAAITSNKLVLPVPWPEFARLLPPFLFELVTTWTAPLPPLFALPMFALALAGAMPARRGAPSFASAAIVSCLALFLTSHAKPFVRVWLFFLPFFVLAVGRGVMLLVARLRLRARVDAALGAVMLAAAVSAVAMATHAAEGTDETGRFAAAPEVTTLLAPVLRPGDRVLAVIPLNGPLLYYFGAQGVDTALLNTPRESMARAFIVLDTERGHTLGAALGAGFIDTVLFTPPSLVGRIPGAEVWRSDRRPSADARAPRSGTPVSLHQPRIPLRRAGVAAAHRGFHLVDLARRAGDPLHALLGGEVVVLDAHADVAVALDRAAQRRRDLAVAR